MQLLPYYLGLKKWKILTYLQERSRCSYECLCGNIVLLTTRFFDVEKFTILTPLSLLSW